MATQRYNTDKSFRKVLETIILLLCLFLSQAAFAQFEDDDDDDNDDDTEEQAPNKSGVILEKDSSWVHGPHTSKYVTLKDLYEIRWEESLMDTALLNFHRYNYRDISEYKYQYTGNLNSPTRSIYFKMPYYLTDRIGLEAYKPYKWTDDNIQYYNALTPVTDWTGVIGGENRTILRTLFSRNITPYWNVGLWFNRITESLLVGQENISKQIFGQIRTDFMANSRYESPDNRYKLLVHYRQQFHDGAETGGLNTSAIINSNEAIESFDDLFLLSRGLLSNNLENVESTKKEYFWKVYHQYALVDSASLQVFHNLTISKQWFSYFDEDPTATNGRSFSNTDYYERFFENGEELSSFPEIALSEVNLRYIDNQVGVKSRVKGVFLSAFARLRTQSADVRNSFLPAPKSTFLYSIPAKIPNRFFMGGQASFMLKDSTTEVSFKAELELGNAITRDFEGSLKSKYGYFSLRNANFIQDRIKTYYISPFNVGWRNDFSNSNATQIYLAPRLPLKNNGFIDIYAELTRISNFVYNDEFATPQVYDDNLQYARYGIKANVKLWHIRQLAEFIYTDNPHSNVYRTPELFANYQISYENKITSNMFLNLGLDFHWNSKFLADGFNPVIQQFYLQNNQEIGDYPLMDVFLNLRIRRTNIFLKVVNVMAGVTANGYYDTPEFMGQKTYFDYGLRWLLFD